MIQGGGTEDRQTLQARDDRTREPEGKVGGEVTELCQWDHPQLWASDPLLWVGVGVLNPVTQPVECVNSPQVFWGSKEDSEFGENLWFPSGRSPSARQIGGLKTRTFQISCLD